MRVCINEVCRDATSAEIAAMRVIEMEENARHLTSEEVGRMLIAAQEGWEPSTDTASLWEQVCESHAGTMEDPIPYSGNMALAAGLYYIQDYTIYLCTRDTGNPVYNALSELAGIYVEVV